MGHHQTHQHTHYGVPEREEREKGAEKIFEETNGQRLPRFDQRYESVHRGISLSSRRVNSKRFTPRYIIMKPLKCKEKS